VKPPGPRDFHVTSYLRRCCGVTGTPRKKRMWKASRNPPRAFVAAGESGLGTFGMRTGDASYASARSRISDRYHFAEFLFPSLMRLAYDSVFCRFVRLYGCSRVREFPFETFYAGLTPLEARTFDTVHSRPPYCGLLPHRGFLNALNVP